MIRRLCCLIPLGMIVLLLMHPISQPIVVAQSVDTDIGAQRADVADGRWATALSLPNSNLDSIAVVDMTLYAIYLQSGITRLARWDEVAAQWVLIQADTETDSWRSLQAGEDGRLYALRKTHTAALPYRIAVLADSAWVDVTTPIPFSNFPLDSVVAVRTNAIYAIDTSAIMAIWNGSAWTIKYARTPEDGTIGEIHHLYRCGSSLYFTISTTSQVNEHGGDVQTWVKKVALATNNISNIGRLDRLGACSGQTYYGWEGRTINIGTENSITRSFSIGPAEANPYITAMVQTGSYVYVVGSFDTIDGVQTGSVARWNGSSWEGLAPIFQRANGTPWQVVAWGHQVVLGGAFFGPTGNARNVTAWTQNLPYTTYSPLLSK